MYLPVEWPLSDLVSLRARSVPDHPALVGAGTDRSWTYAELSAGPVASRAAGMRSVGLTPGSRLGVVLRPGVQSATLVHAAARAGVVLVPLPADAPVDDLSTRCSAGDVDAVLGDDETVEAVRHGFDGPVYTVDEAGPAGVEPLVAPAADAPSSYRWRPEEVQWLVFTSGTLGEPKAVELTPRNLVASATASALRLGVRPADRWLACLPTHHVGGLAPMVRSALYGTTVVAQSGFDAEATAEAMAEWDVSAISLVPTMLTRLLDAGWSPPSTLRFVLLGGAAASTDLIDRCADADVPVCPSYGATETASQIATARPDEARDHPGTVGRPLDGVEVTVQDEAGEPVPPGEPGELVVSGPVVAAGYADDAGSGRRFDGGAFRTRDRGYRSPAGRLWILGRLDDAVVTGGETVHPSDVESVLRDHPAVADVAVVGLADEEWGEVVAALVVAAGAREVDRSTVRRHCRRRLAPHAVPKVVATTDELPRTDSGTVDRQAVRDRLRSARRAEDL